MHRPPKNRPGRRLAGAAIGLCMTAASCLAVGTSAAAVAATADPDTTTTTTTTTAETEDRQPGGGFVSPGIPDPDESAAARAESDEDGSGTSILTILLAAAIAAAAGFAAGWFVSGRRSGTSPQAPAGAMATMGSAYFAAPVGPPTAAPVPPDAAVPADGASAGAGVAGNQALVEHRDALIQSFIEIGEMVSSEAVRARVAEDLGRIGVNPVSVGIGDRFDPHRHRGVQAVPAPTPNADATVAACDRVGWADGDRVLRLPEVVVFRWEPTS